MKKSLLAVAVTAALTVGAGVAMATPASFFDVPDGSTHAGAIEWAGESGVMQGYRSGEFGPDAPVLRGQLAAVLQRYDAIIGKIEGPQGPVGPQGIAGADGPVGPQGAPGADGAVGPQGAPGADGADGADGPQGAPGVDGALGPVGPVGPVGPAGSQGEQGLPGADGPVGPAGPAGPQGDMGMPGPEGPPGVPGPVGPQGEPGPAGSGSNEVRTFSAVMSIGDDVLLLEQGSLQLRAHCFEDGATGTDQLRINVVGDADLWYSTTGSTKQNGRGDIVMLGSMSASRGEALYSRLIDRGHAMADDGSYITFQAENTAFGLHVFGHDCVVAGVGLTMDVAL